MRKVSFVIALRKVSFVIGVLGLYWLFGCGSSGTKLSDSPPKQPQEVILVSLQSNELAVIDPNTHEVIGIKNVGAWGYYTNNHFDPGPVMWFNWGRNLYAIRVDDFDLIASAFGSPLYSTLNLSLATTSDYGSACSLDGEGKILKSLRAATPVASGIMNISLENTFVDVTPDGRYAYVTRRGEDQICVLDNALGTPNFGRIIRCINVVTGEVRDGNGNLIRRYPTLYTPGGGEIEGGNRGVRGGAGRCDIYQNTCRAGACDASVILREDGKVIFCEPDWYGGTISCLDITDDDRLYQHMLPVLVRGSRLPGGFMGTLSINFYDGRSYYFVENREHSMSSTDPCRGSEYILDVTDLSDIRLVQMIVPRFSCLDGITTDSLIDGEIYEIRVRYVYSYNYDANGRVTGINRERIDNVRYKFHRSTGPFVSSGYLQKVNPRDPGPSFIVDGLPIAPHSSDGRPVRMIQTPSGKVIKHDEVYIAGLAPGYGQIGVVSYRGFEGNGRPPFPISHRINLVFNTESSVMTFTSDGRKVFVNDRANPIVYVIDTFTKSLVDIISLPAPSEALTTKTLLMPARAPTTPAGGGGAGGSGGRPPLPNPCG
jgi:DNA-binding beta-propeller fold protein YncE